MKTCSYCGAEYQDDVVECPVDHTPLGGGTGPSGTGPIANKKQETAILLELLQVHSNCDARVAVYRRRWWALTLTSWGLIFFASLLTRFDINVMLCLALALLGGAIGGFGLLFAAAARNTPVVVRFTTLDEERVKKRLGELQNG